MLEVAVERAPDASAFTYCEDGESVDDMVTMAEFHARVLAAAGVLQEMHAPGERVVLVHGPGIAFAVSLLACSRAGLVPVAAHPPGIGRQALAVERLATVVRNTDAAGVIVDASASSLLAACGHRADLASVALHVLEDLESSELVSSAATPRRADDAAFVQTTSGSTEGPKCVVLTHRNLLEQAALLRAVTEADNTSCSVTWAPLFHDMGLASAILLPLSVPYHSVLMSPFAFVQRPVRWLQAIHRTRATIAGGPNFAYELLLRSITVDERARLDLSSWRFAFVGAEPIRATTLERFTQAFAPVGFHGSSWYCCWGLAESTCVATGRPKGSGARVGWFDRKHMTEAGRLVAVDPSAVGATAAVGCGAALPGHELLVASPEDCGRLPAGEVGELWVRGPCVGAGYWNRPNDDAFSGVLADGSGPFLRTGDLGALDEDGELFVVGRIKDMLIVRGRNLAPQDLEATSEQAHGSLPGGANAAFSVDDGIEERVVVVQGVRSRADPELDAARDAVRAALAAEHGIDADIVFVRPRSIPRTASGKVRRGACRDAFLTGSLSRLDPADADGALA